MNCHSWMGPVGVMEGVCDTGVWAEYTEEPSGGGECREGGQLGGC